MHSSVFVQIGGVPRVLERLRLILGQKYPAGPCDEHNNPHLLDRKGILVDVVEYIRRTWNMVSLGSRIYRSEVCVMLPQQLFSHYCIFTVSLLPFCMYCFVQLHGVSRSSSDATTVSAGQVSRALILLGVAGLPVKDTDVLPGCGDLTVFDLRSRGITFGQSLSHKQPQDVMFQPAWASNAGFQLLSLPLVFIDAFTLFALSEPESGASPIESAFRMYRSELMPLLAVDAMSSAGFEKITFAHLAVRIAVAKAWASSRPEPARVPIYHVLGTELPQWLEGIEFDALDVALPVPAPAPADQSWMISNPSAKIRLRGHDVLYSLEVAPGSPPFLLLSAAQSASFDIMISLKPTVGAVIVVLIDCAFTSDSASFVSELCNFKGLPSKITQLGLNGAFQGARLASCLVSNRTATAASRRAFESQDIVLADYHRLDCFFSPTLAPLIRSLRPQSGAASAELK
jgi:hypothetical protein